jgi:hypothetical protein
MYYIMEHNFKYYIMEHNFKIFFFPFLKEGILVTSTVVRRLKGDFYGPA